MTRVISRVVLQQLLAETAQKMAGDDIILNDQNVVDYEHVVRHSTAFPSHGSSPHILHKRVCMLIKPASLVLELHAV